jgi:ATP-binding cassette subfamily C (CFTR/MRP) protein 1
MLTSMKSLKLMGLANTIQSSIQAQRIREIALSKKFRWMVVALNTIGKFLCVVSLNFPRVH